MLARLRLRVIAMLGFGLLASSASSSCLDVAANGGGLPLREPERLGLKYPLAETRRTGVRYLLVLVAAIVATTVTVRSTPPPASLLPAGGQRATKSTRSCLSSRVPGVRKKAAGPGPGIELESESESHPRVCAPY